MTDNRVFVQDSIEVVPLFCDAAILESIAEKRRNEPEKRKGECASKGNPSS